MHELTIYLEQHYEDLCKKFAYQYSEEYSQYCANEDDYDVYTFCEDHDEFHDYVWEEFKEHQINTAEMLSDMYKEK